MTLRAVDVIARLEALPQQIYEVELEAVELEGISEIDRLLLKDFQEALDIAELNARLSTGGQGGNATERKRLEEQAITNSDDVKLAREELRQFESRIAETVNNRKRKLKHAYKLQREFEALQSIAMLQAGQMRISATKLELKGEAE